MEEQKSAIVELVQSIDNPRVLEYLMRLTEELKKYYS